MHRNTYICAPKHLNRDLSLKNAPSIFIAGQLSGVEGYVESACSGIIAALSVYKRLKGKEFIAPPINTMIGALLNYLAICSPNDFSPMNANYGIVPRDTKLEKIEVSNIALASLKDWWSHNYE